MYYKNRVTAVTSDSFILTFALTEMLAYCQYASKHRTEIEKKIIEQAKNPILNPVNYYISETSHHFLTSLKDNPLPTLNYSNFVFPSSGLRLDASENIVSVKIKYIGSGANYFESMVEGIKKGEYVLMPRAVIKTKHNGLQFLTPFENPVTEREAGELKLLGFDFFYKTTQLSMESSTKISEVEDLFKKAYEEKKGWTTKDYPPKYPMIPFFYDGVRLANPQLDCVMIFNGHDHKE